MRKSILFILILLFSCQKDELMIIEPYPQYEMIFEVSMSKVTDGQEFSFQVLSTEEHTLIISHLNNSVVAKETFIPSVGLNTRLLYINSLPKGELNLILFHLDSELKRTKILIE